MKFINTLHCKTEQPEERVNYLRRSVTTNVDKKTYKTSVVRSRVRRETYIRTVVRVLTCFCCDSIERGNVIIKWTNVISEVEKRITQKFKILTYNSSNMETVRDMQRFMERRERNLDVIQSCFQLLNEKRKRAASL